jgi:hypothetical protein
MKNPNEITKADIHNLLLIMGFRSELSGYDYLKEAIYFVIKNHKNSIHEIQMIELYEGVAELFPNTTYRNIGRNIQYLIKEWNPMSDVYSTRCENLVQNLISRDRITVTLIVRSIAKYLLME